MKKYLRPLCIMIAFALLISLSACGTKSAAVTEEKIPIKVLIVPKFEVGEMTGDFPGEAQFFYEEYFTDAAKYDTAGSIHDEKLYVKDGLAMFISGEGKINTAIGLTAVLTDDRFDFSDCYVISEGCGGGAYGRTVLGDVILVTGTVDVDLGHRAGMDELTSDRPTGWFREHNYDEFTRTVIDQALIDEVYPLIKDIELELPEDAQKYMAKSFDNAEWAVRAPKVIKGTAITSDTYWKGSFYSNEANFITENYDMPDPYMITEMEDAAIALVMKTFDMTDRFLSVRVNVNMDVFTGNMTPENTWGEDIDDTLITEDESAGCFDENMANLYKVCSVIIEHLKAK